MISFEPIRVRRQNQSFDLGALVDKVLGSRLQNEDVMVISSKFISISEGRVMDLDDVIPGSRALELSQRVGIPPELCELVIRESDRIIGGVMGFLLTEKEGLLTPNAGIDRSNIEHGKVVLYPRNPLESAVALVESLKFRRGVDVGVVVSDSRLMPTRKGTVGVALAAAGIEAVVDLRGKPDLFGNRLRVTSQAIADDLCSGAQIVMGEANESTPIVLIRGLRGGLPLNRSMYPMASFAVEPDQCVYMRSLGYRAT